MHCKLCNWKVIFLLFILLMFKVSGEYCPANTYTNSSNIEFREIVVFENNTPTCNANCSLKIFNESGLLHQYELQAVNSSEGCYYYYSVPPLQVGDYLFEVNCTLNSLEGYSSYKIKVVENCSFGYTLYNETTVIKHIPTGGGEMSVDPILIILGVVIVGSVIASSRWLLFGIVSAVASFLFGVLLLQGLSIYITQPIVNSENVTFILKQNILKNEFTQGLGVTFILLGMYLLIKVVVRIWNLRRR